MLPENMELETPQSKEWPLIPADVYQTEITNIEYKSEPNRWRKTEADPAEKQVMTFEFTIIEEGEFYGRKLWQKMSPVKPYPPQQSGKSSWVYRLATAMEGHAITQVEADQYGSSNINGYIHRQVRVTVKHSEPKNGKIYNNVESFLPIKTELPIFDEKKVPTENQPAAKTEPSGLDKLRATAEGLNTAQPVATGQIPLNTEGVAPDIAEEAARMLEEESPLLQDAMDVSDIPF
jgi:hypothetical protein